MNRLASSARLPRSTWEKNLAWLRKRHGIKANLMCFLSHLGAFYVVNELLYLLDYERMQPLTGFTFALFYTAMTYFALPLLAERAKT